MTLRQALMSVDLDEVYRLINKKDSEIEPKSKAPTLQQTVDAYTSVVKELLEKPRTRKYSMSILVHEAEDWFDKHKYADVCFLNPRYVAPPKGAKPWGGNKFPKKGKYYNCNLNKHNKTFAMGFTSWSKIIDTPIINDAKYSMEKVVAEILWELTFYGWTEKKCDDHAEEIKGKLKEAMKEIKEGKCIELPPKKKGGYKIVIPDCVSKQIVDIANQLNTPIKPPQTKKCTTCWGYGLWAMGEASPMGPMDASDGMPTKACPECGANPNPMKG